MLLERCNGPACPRCGCQDADVLVQPASDAQLRSLHPKLVETYGTASWFSGGNARCKHCGLRFNFRALPEPPEEPEEPEVPAASPADPLAGIVLAGTAPASVPQGIPPPITYPVEACPGCQSPDVRVTTSRGRVRHHKCRACGAKFKSVEPK